MKATFYLIFAVFLTCNSLSCNGQNLSPIVSLQQGQVQGRVSSSRIGHEYYSYLGIPFAQPPRRFEPPRPVDIPGWDGIRNATSYGQPCTQAAGVPGTPNRTIIGSEDCLFANVYTKDIQPQVLKPVLVFIYGSFMNLFSNFYGEYYVMDEDIILVTFNYRASVMGFLNVGYMNGNVTIAAGNMALKDQTMALRWIQANIREFGGDPNKVTIFGNSGGACSVNYQMISPTTQGLFHRAILSGGSALFPWGAARNPTYPAQALGQALNCPTDTSNELVECLLEKTAEEIIQADYSSLIEDIGFGIVIPFGPSIEAPSSPEPFVQVDPEISMAAGNFLSVPTIMNMVANEGTFLSNPILSSPELAEELNANWSRIIPTSLVLRGVIPDANMTDAVKEIREFYFGHRDISKDTGNELETLFSDRGFFYNVRAVGKYFAKKSREIYPSIFAFADGRNAQGRLPFGIVDHADELRYVFEHPGKPDYFGTDFSKRFVKLIAYFAEHGYPDSRIIGDSGPWEPISYSQALGEAPLKWFHFDSPPSIQTETFTKRMNFWNYLLDKYSADSTNHSTKM